MLIVEAGVAHERRRVARHRDSLADRQQMGLLHFAAIAVMKETDSGTY
jgi:hypothetical protein